MCIKSALQRGVTLIELIVSLVIISIAAIGIIQLLNVTSKTSAEPVRRKQALLLAEALMEEVTGARFTFCGVDDANVATAQVAAVNGTPAAGGLIGCATTVEELGTAAVTRPFTNVNDYHVAGGRNMHTVVAGVSRVVDAAGNSINVPGYQAVVTIEPAVTIGPAGSTIVSGAAAAQMEVLLITVTVSDTVLRSNVIVLESYRTRYAPRS